MGRSGGRGCREGSLRKGGRVGRSEKGWGGGIGIKDVELFWFGDSVDDDIINGERIYVFLLIIFRKS